MSEELEWELYDIFEAGLFPFPIYDHKTARKIVKYLLYRGVLPEEIADAIEDNTVDLQTWLNRNGKNMVGEWVIAWVNETRKEYRREKLQEARERGEEWVDHEFDASEDSDEADSDSDFDRWLNRENLRRATAPNEETLPKCSPAGASPGSVGSRETSQLPESRSTSSSQCNLERGEARSPGTGRTLTTPKSDTDDGEMPCCSSQVDASPEEDGHADVITPLIQTSKIKSSLFPYTNGIPWSLKEGGTSGKDVHSRDFWHRLQFGACDAFSDQCHDIAGRRAMTMPLLTSKSDKAAKLTSYLSHFRINSKVFPHTWHISRSRREKSVLGAGERMVKLNPLTRCRCTLSHYFTMQTSVSNPEPEHKHPCIGLFLGPENVNVLCQDSMCTETDTPGHVYVLTEAGHAYFSCSTNVMYKVLATCQREKWLLEFFSPRLHVEVVWKVMVTRHLTALKIISEQLRPYCLHSNWYKCSLDKIIDVITAHVPIASR